MAVEEDPPPARGEEELDILDHGALVADMKRNDQVSLEERAKKAKSNRIKQLQIFEEFEKRGAAPATAGGRHAKIKFPPDVPLMDAAAKGAVDDMRELMKKGEQISCNLFQTICRMCFKQLQAKNTKKNKNYRHSFSPGLDPNANNYEGLTALHNCCIDGNIEMVKLLLDHGAKVNVSDKDGWTPLHAAATCGFTDIVKALIKAGAELLAINGDGDMPFDIAEDENTLNVIEEAMRSQGITNEQVQEKRTELHVTMFEDVKELVKENMSLDAFVNEEGATLLHVAIAHGFNDVVEFLLDNGASVDIGDCDGWEPVHVAAFFNNIVALTLLVTKRQANLRALNNSGVDPLKLADSLDTRKAVQSLLKTDQPQLKREHKELEVMASLDSLASDDTVAENEPLSFLEGTSRETNIDEVLQNKIDSPIDKNEIQSSKSSLIGDGDFMPVLKRVESISTKRSSIREAKKQAPTIKNANFIRRDSYEAYDNSYDLLLVKKKPDIQKVKSTQGSETEVNPKQSLEEIEESEDCEKIQEGIRSELSQGPTKIDVLPAAASGTVHSEPIFANEEPIANSNELTGSVHPSPFGNDPPEHVYELQEEEMAEADKPGNTYVNTAEPLNSSTLKNNEYTLPSDSESSDLEQAALGALETSKTYPSAVLKKEEPASTTLYDNGSRGTSIYDTEPRIYLANNAEKPVAPSSDKKAGSSLYKNDTPLTSQDEKSSSLYENEISNTSLYDDPSLTNGSFSSSSANNNPSATTYQNGIFTADDNLYEVDSSSISSQESDSQERRKKENPSQVGALGVAQPGKDGVL
ncbi:hypothetical protein HAZT_HAZT002366 [Hyalella azteca]|uniref:Uncharacterized protein n=1 Tax=Hyalella azteca TaxID=294128 RepID=A0A6A0HBN1_HYAAZ|nr:hypothetical protein HAZT_HAZT002366 [Hyalella azteca]